jgi:CRISPR-associated exonuclease Cas4
MVCNAPPKEGERMSESQSGDEIEQSSQKSQQEPLPEKTRSMQFVSASDVERHTYCPLSWHLSRQGVNASGERVQEGINKHSEINQQMVEYQNARSDLKRQITIWTWWFGIIIAYSIDAVAFFALTKTFPPNDFAKYLVLLAVVWLALSITLIALPWREWFGWNTAIQSLEQDLKTWVDEHSIVSIIQGPDFKGGWSKGGRVEASMMLGAIVLAIHGIGLWGARNREQAGFILLMVAMLWTLFSSWRLQQALVAETVANQSIEETGLKDGSEVVFSDEGDEAGILVDEELGLRGKPDQIIVVDGEFIPLEQKTGRIPKSPFASHRMQLLAYLKLIDANTSIRPQYGVLRYGKDELHQIDWNTESEQILIDSVHEIQRLMREGGATRNHERPGKCKNCSRRHGCSESLV